MKKRKKPALRYALLSVYDKKGIVNFTKVLAQHNFKIISTGGTSKILKKAKIPLIPIEEITGRKESFDGLVKTISFAVEAGILFDRSNKSHLKKIKKLGIVPLDLVVCNFYPPTSMIDIGGPTMVRAAAKNYHYVGVVVDPADYGKIAKEIKNKGWLSIQTRAELAVKAFEETALYDCLIHRALSSIRVSQFRRGSFTRRNVGVRMTVEALQNQKNIYLFLRNGRKLRYGENPHQKGFFYSTFNDDPLSLAKFKQIQGKETSLNNLLDIDAAINALANIENGQPACVVIKHGNPCGAARADSIQEAFINAWNGDPLAAFGSIIALNRPVDKKLAKLLLSEGRFFEVLLSPQIEKTARQVLKKKKNLQVFTNPALVKPRLDCQLDFKKVRSGFLVQEPDLAILKKGDLKVVTQKKPTNDQLEDLLFAWKVCRVCQSNSVVLVKDETLISAGVGQQDRKRCCQLAVVKAGPRARESVAASDGFFPFPDGPEILAKSGVKVIIQPGGSIKDKEIINFCNQQKISMVFTGTRAFKH